MSAATDALDTISVDEIYPLPRFKAASGLNDFAIRQARRRGLKVIACGKRKFVRGRDFYDYLDSQVPAENDSAA